MATNSVDFLNRYFDLSDSGRAIVLLRGPNDSSRIAACLVTEVQEPVREGGWLARQIALSDSEDVAQVAYTSGTEGEPKGVLLSYKNLTSTAHRIQEVMKLTSEVREYIGVPVFHSFGLGRARAVLGAGGAVYVPPNGFDLRELSAMLEGGEINAISAVPSLWRLVLKNRHLFERHASRVKWVEIGSQPMSVAEKSELRDFFSSACIVQHYGLTEASRSTFLNLSEATSAELESVGRPAGDVEIQIAANGRIRIRGSNVAEEMLVEGRKVRVVDQGGWLITNDLGEMREGQLFFLGRADDVLNISGIKVPPHAVEERMAELLQVATGLCVARVPDELRGDGLLIAVADGLDRSDLQLREAAECALRERGVSGAGAISVVRWPELPQTESGKPRRAEVSRKFSAQLGAWQPTTSAPILPHNGWSRLPAFSKPRGVLGLYQKAFSRMPVTRDASFVSLGGDSLSFVEVSVELEDYLGHLPENWQTLSVAELEALPRQRTLTHVVDTTVFFRFIGMLAIVMGHFDVLNVSGSTYLLLAIAGFNFARFQLPHVLSSGSVRPVVETALRVAVPTFLALALIEFKTKDFEPIALFLLDNWTDARNEKFGFWFLELIVQVLMLTALLMSWGRARDFAIAHDFRFALAVLATCVMLSIGVPLFWNAEHLYNRVPHMLMWLFALGWVVASANSREQRLLAGVLVLLLPPLIWSHVLNRFWLGHGVIWVAVGGISLLLVSRVRLFYPLNRIAALVAGASMFIYISHYTLRGWWHRVGLFQHPLIDVLLGIVGGIILWRIWEITTDRLLKGLARSKFNGKSEFDPV
ncbi:non-ribosomal peptide synthetase component E (peptide arylation enzyme) [Hydrogenophaga palleronii]|uniref:Non-ribosomal peptide synthetase component E (Peptide arylation enzyme) n=1 Tax=Hydrogenophaga palleronii TaxID=65655 RepID=A0ABU1WQA4_9BURK|nr:AMP-binding protein [Hydrogenophaga palleronii]MDR7151480.1 non-ribosomal peptide synthetase component E (peptide arylation enzyme) [Hydrogenophaga palleronii]